MSLINRAGTHPRHPAIPQDHRTSPMAPSARSSNVVNAARDARERLLDDTLAASFPASDPPPWTLGRRT
jgi:hypothetical protein